MFSLIKVRQTPVFLESKSNMRQMRGSSGSRINFRLVIWLLVITFGAAFLVGALIRGRIRSRNVTVMSQGPSPFKPMDSPYRRPNLPGRDMVFSGPKMDPNLKVVHMDRQERPALEQMAPQQPYVGQPERPPVEEKPHVAPAAPKPDVERAQLPQRRPKVPAATVQRAATKLVDKVIDRIIAGKTPERKSASPSRPKTSGVRYKPEQKPLDTHAPAHGRGDFHGEASGDGMPDGFFDDEDGRDTSKYEYKPRRA